MKTIIAGTRTMTDYDLVRLAVDLSVFKDEITEVVCGAAEDDFYRGKLNVDVLGFVWARLHRIPVKFFPVTQHEWETYGKFAGPRRNQLMALYADALILVWDGVSRGSESMLGFADDYNLTKSVLRVKQDAEGKWSAESLKTLSLLKTLES